MAMRDPVREAPERLSFAGRWSSRFVERSGEPFVEAEQAVEIGPAPGGGLRVRLRLRRRGEAIELPAAVGEDPFGKPRLYAEDGDLRLEAEHFVAADSRGRAQVMLCGMILRRRGGPVEEDDTESFTAVNEGDPPGARPQER